MADEQAQLIDYALGVLPDSERTELEAALASDTSLRAELDEVTHLIGAMDDRRTTLEPSPDAKARLMTALQSGATYAGFEVRVAELFDLSEARAREVLDNLQQPGATPWEASFSEGIHLLHFDGGDRIAADQDCGIVHMTANTTFPPHRHGSDEWALILQGELVETDGTVSLPGDLVLRPAGSEHGFTAGPEGVAFAVMTRADALEFDI